MTEIWNMAFLKQHDLSGFLDNSFLVSDCAGAFGDIMLQKWRDLSEKSMLSLLFSKSQTEIRGITLPGVQKSAQNLGHDNARCAEICPESGARLCTGCNGLPEIWGMFMPGVHKSARNLRHVYARCAEVFPKSEA